MKALSQETLKSVLHYCPVTGVFTYHQNTSRRKAGEPAGYVKSDGYRELQILGKRYYAHRIAFLYMTSSFPSECVDHINHNRSDNRWCNLREATRAQNNAHSRIRKDNTSGVKGVSWNKSYKKWLAYIAHDKQRYTVGLFDSLVDAAEAVAAKRKELHGMFACDTPQ